MSILTRIKDKYKCLFNTADRNMNDAWDNEVIERIQITNGKMKKMLGMKLNQFGFHTSSNDSQIWITFDCPVRALYVRVELESLDSNINKGAFELYYSLNETKEYSEENSVKLRYEQRCEIEKTIFFNFPIKNVRIDPIDICDFSYIKKVTVEGATSVERTKLYGLERQLSGNNTKKKLLLFSHSLEESGAPILLYNIACKLKQDGYDIVLLSREEGNGFLENKYKELAIPIFVMSYNKESSLIQWVSDSSSTEGQKGIYCEYLIKYLVKCGFTKVITNTIVTGEYVKLLKEQGLYIISLIHEMKKTIEMYNFCEMGEQIAQYADKVIFPDKIVMDDFNTLFRNVKGEMLVRPQGVYLKYVDEKAYINNMFEEFKLPQKATIVLSSGTAILRKGIDLFINAAQCLLESEKGEDYHFIWVGNFDEKSELGGWLMLQLERYNIKERFHFIPFMQNPCKYRKLLQCADAFWSTSREDPFPSVVLEAMLENVPVFAFENAGGVNTLLKDGRGELISNFNPGELAKQTKAVFENAERKKQLIEDARCYVEKEQDFVTYVKVLEGLLEEGK